MRIATMSAYLIEPGDVLVRMEYDNGGQRSDLATIVGTVLDVVKHGDETEHPDRQHRSWVVRTPAGETITYPNKPSRKLMNTHIDVPSPPV